MNLSLREFYQAVLTVESNNGSLFIKELENEYYSHESYKLLMKIKITVKKVLVC